MLEGCGLRGVPTRCIGPWALAAAGAIVLGGMMLGGCGGQPVNTEENPVGGGTATISGTVVDASEVGTPVGDAYVYVPTRTARSASAEIRTNYAQDVTGADGAYSLEAIPAGMQTLVVEPRQASGYSRIEIMIDIEEGADMALRITVVPTELAEQVAYMTVDPTAATLEPGGTQQYQATVFDETGSPMGLTPVWMVTNQVGTIDADGLFTAGNETKSGSIVAFLSGIFQSVPVTVETAQPENQAPAVAMSAAPTAGSAPLDVAVALQASDFDGSVATMSVDWGDGSDPIVSSTGALPASLSHIYELDGSYAIVAKAWDDEGAMSSAVAAVRVAHTNTDPTCDLSANAVSGRAPVGVTFTLSASDDDEGDGIASWELDFGDGSTPGSGAGLSASQQVSHNYTTVGTHLAHLRVTDSFGGTATDTVAISVSSVDNDPPQALLLATPTSGTAPLTVTFTGDGSDPDGTVTTYSLDFGNDGVAEWSSASAPGAVTHDYSVAGRYEAKLTTTDDDGATAASIVDVSVSPGPELVVAPTSLDFGSGTGALPLSIYNDGGGTITWQCTANADWIVLSDTPGTGDGVVQVTVDRTDLPRGDYDGAVDIVSNDGAVSVPVACHEGNHAPTLSSLTAATAGITPGGSVDVAASASDRDSDPLSYSWSASAGEITGTGASITWTAPNSEGQSTISCSVSDGSASSATASVSIAVAYDTSGIDVTLRGAGRRR